jgi:hypothetical protein
MERRRPELADQYRSLIVQRRLIAGAGEVRYTPLCPLCKVI